MTDKLRFFHDNECQNKAILADYKYWGNTIIYEKLKDYCEKNHITLSGLLIEFPDEETKIEFILYWA